jgi:hypothetical protein
LTRCLREGDGINSLTLAPYGEAMFFDEVLIMRGVLGEEEGREYYLKLKGLRDIFGNWAND